MIKKKRILLVNPWIYDFTAYDFWLRPLGLLCLASLLQKIPHCELFFLDCLDRFHPALGPRVRVKEDGRGPFPKEEVPKPDVLRDIPRKFSRYGLPPEVVRQELKRLPLPDAVMISCVMTYWYPGVQTIVELIRQELGSVPIVLGGIYATLLPEHARRYSGADLVVEGAAELKLESLWEQLWGEKIDEFLEKATRKDFSFPWYSLLRNRDVLPVETSRGCPYHCSFCASRKLNPEFHQKEVSEVVNFLETSHQQFGNRHFVFYDDALLVNKELHLKAILREIIRRQLKVAFHTPNGLHVREIDPELASLFSRTGFRSLFLSQESFDAKILQRCSRKSSPEALARALAALQSAGYARDEINVYLLVGLPGQEAASVRRSIQEVKKMGARPRLAFFSPVPGTQEWSVLVQAGYLSPEADPLLHNKILFPYLWSSISPEELNELKHLALPNT